jgi:hypothetical protein
MGSLYICGTCKIERIESDLGSHCVFIKANP